MMNKPRTAHFRVLGIAPSTRGFGFAVIEENERLVDWGVKSISGDKNTGSVAKVEEIIALYEPGVIVLEDAESRDSLRSPRIRALSRQLITVATSRGITVKLLSRERVRRIFFPDGRGSKHAVAEILVARFPEELGSRLPPKRRPWTSEDYRMDIFDAVALAVTFPAGARNCSILK